METAQLCVIIVDIDHFKQINDTYGHQKGDEVIVRFAQIIQNTVRGADVVIRSGGDEFVILLPDASLQVSIDVAERLTAAIEANIIPHPDGQFTISATCGVAGSGTEFERLFQAADNALYDAKANGRNQVCVAQAAPAM